MDYHFIPRKILILFMIFNCSNSFGQKAEPIIRFNVTGNKSSRISPGEIVNIIFSAEATGSGTLKLRIKPEVPAFASNWDSKTVSCTTSCTVVDTLTLAPTTDDCGIYTFIVTAQISGPAGSLWRKHETTIEVVPKIKPEPPFTNSVSNLICWSNCTVLSQELFHFPNTAEKNRQFFNSLATANPANECQAVESLSSGIQYGYFLETTTESDGNFVTLTSDTVYSIQDNTPPPKVEVSEFVVNSMGKVTIQWPIIPDDISYIEKYIVSREKSNAIESTFTVIDTLPFFPVSNIEPLNYLPVRTIVGESLYLDGIETILRLPDEIEGSTMIKTAKQDCWDESEKSVSFNLKSPSNIYIAFDNIYNSRTDWLRRDFQTIQKDLITQPHKMQLRLFKSRKIVQPGEVILGGNFAAGAGSQNSGINMFVVFIQPIKKNHPYIYQDTMSFSDSLGAENDLQTFRYRIDAFDAAGNMSEGIPSPLIILDLEGHCKPIINNWSIVENDIGEKFSRGSTNDVCIQDPTTLAECIGFRDTDSLRFQAVRENAALFEIHRPEDEGVHFFDSDWISAENLCYEFSLLSANVDPNFVNGLKYYYRVAGKDIHGNISVWSDAVAAVQDHFPPSDIRNLSAKTEIFENEGDGCIRLDWQPAVDPVSGLESYHIYRSDDRGMSFTPLEIIDARETTYRDTLSKIAVNKIFNYKIAIQDRVGNFRTIENSDWEVSLRALVGPVIETDSSKAILCGTNILGIKSDSFTIYWEDFDNTDIAGYHVEILRPDLSIVLKTINNPQTSEVKCPLDGIDGIYKVRLRAFYSGGSKTIFSNTITVRKKMQLQSVENLTARQDSNPTGDIILSWSHPDGAEIIEFQVYHWTEGENQTENPVAVLPGDSLQWIQAFEEDSLKAFQCNYYSIKVNDCYNLSSNADPVVVQYSNRPPEFDRDKTELDKNIVRIFWNHPSPEINNTFSYNSEIFVLQDSVSPSPKLTANLFNKTDFTLYNALPGHTYIFQVKETILDALNQTCSDVFVSALSRPLFVPVDNFPTSVDFEVQALPVQPGSSMGNIFVSWRGYSNVSVDDYLVQWSVSGSGTVLDSILVHDHDTLLVRGMDISKTFQFSVIAVDFLDQRSLDNEIKIVNFNPKWLFTPKIQKMNPSCFRDSVNIAWSWVDENVRPVDGDFGADSILIELSIDPNFNFYKSILRSGFSKSQTFRKETDYPFINNQNNILYARIRAKDQWNHFSPWSSEYSELGVFSGNYDQFPPEIVTCFVDSTVAPIFGEEGEVSVHLRWDEVSDNCSGTWYYEITRNDIIIGKDTTRSAMHKFIDRNVKIDENLITSKWRVHAVDSLDNRQEFANAGVLPFIVEPPDSGWCLNDSTFCWNEISFNDSSQKVSYFVEGARFVELFGNYTTNIVAGPLETTCFNYNVPWENIHWRVKARIENFESPWSAAFPCLINIVSGVHSNEQRDFEYLPEEFGLQQNYPNPFNPETTIKYAIPKFEVDGVEVLIELFNMKGQKVRTLVHDTRQPGEYTIVWKGIDDNDVLVGNGIYVYRMRARNFVSSHKMVFLK